MRLLSIFVTSVLALGGQAKSLSPKGPACPEGDGLYAVGCSPKYLQCVNNVEYEQSCPEGLYFDRLMARCERRSANHLCNDKNRKTLNVRQKAVSINCVGRLSGDYPLDKTICNENYYQCANGISYMRKCPFNQVYSPVLKRCDYASNCVENHGVKDQAAAAYASPTYEADNYVVTTKEFENGHRDINCTVLGDSFFVSDAQCSPYFWQCANGKLFRKTCPERLIYVLDQNLCDYPESVQGCPEYNGSETSYQAASTTTQKPASLPPRTTQAPYVPAAAPTVPAYTPPRTTHAPYVPAAAPTAPVYSPPVTTQTPVPSQSQPVDAPVYSQPISYQPSLHGDCETKGDGFFEIKPCHASFLTCSSGVGRVVSCANELVFDSRVSACDYVDVCKGPRKQEDIPVLYNHGGAMNEKPAEIKVDFDCAGKADGQYVKEACTKKYYRCFDGRAFALTCPADLVYNQATFTCDYADNCEKNYMEPTQVYEAPTTTTTESYKAPVTTSTQAYGVPSTTVQYTQPPRDTERPSTIYSRPVYTTKAPSTSALYEQPSTTTAYTTQRPVTLPIALDDFSCTNLEDGNHASGLCKKIFYTCSHNQLSATKCPGNLVYNPYLGQCDYEENVRDCATYVEQVATTVAQDPTTTQAPYAPVVVATTQTPQHSALCEMLADGNYGHKCQNYFFQCYRFETTQVMCPAGLFYSRKNNRCDYKENVEDCPEYKPQPSTTTPAAEQPSTAGYTKYPNIDYTTSTPGAVDTTPIAETFSCYGRADGIYALPYCSKEYVQCIHGRSLIAVCTTGLFYSEKSGLCDYKENVDVCKVRQGSDVIDDNACIGKSDGYYSAGCSSHYFSCMEERIRKVTCPKHLKFSEKKKQCTYPTDVEECSISAQPIRDTPAVPSDFCTIRTNGLQAFGPCSPHYVVCDNMRAIAGTCAAPLVFNGETLLCDYRSNNKECESDYIPPASDSTVGYTGYTTKAYEQPSTTTTTTTVKPYYKVETTTTTTTAAPSTTTPAQEPPVYTTSTTTEKPYETVPTTTPSRDVEVPTTQRPYEETTTRATTTTTSYVAPTTSSQSAY